MGLRALSTEKMRYPGATRPVSVDGNVDRRVLAALRGDYPGAEIVPSIFDPRVKVLHAHFHHGADPGLEHPEQVLGKSWAERATRPGSGAREFALQRNGARSLQVIRVELATRVTVLNSATPRRTHRLVIDQEGTLIRDELLP